MKSSSLAFAVLTALTMSLAACGEASKSNRDNKKAIETKTQSETRVVEDFECDIKSSYKVIPDLEDEAERAKFTYTYHNTSKATGTQTTRTVGDQDFVTTNQKLQSTQEKEGSDEKTNRSYSQTTQRTTTKSKLENGNLLEKSSVTGVMTADEGTTFKDKDGNDIMSKTIESNYEEEIKVEDNKRTLVGGTYDGEKADVKSVVSTEVVEGNVRTVKSVAGKSSEEKYEGFRVQTLASERTCVYTKK